jgi:hypothetical protein
MAEERYGSALPPDEDEPTPVTIETAAQEPERTLVEVEARSFTNLGGEVPEEVEARRRLEGKAQKTAQACGKCGKLFGKGETIFRGQVWRKSLFGLSRRMVPFCRECTPQGKYWLSTCETCGRTVANPWLVGRSRLHTTCSQYCRYRIYKVRQNKRRALAREGVNLNWLGTGDGPMWCGELELYPSPVRIPTIPATCYG